MNYGLLAAAARLDPVRARDLAANESHLSQSAEAASQRREEAFCRQRVQSGACPMACERVKESNRG